MVTVPRLSKGLRRHIRNQKAMIRRQFNDTPEAADKIKALIEMFHKPKVSQAGPKVEPVVSQDAAPEVAKNTLAHKSRVKSAKKKA
ncbi:MAG: hypothetical protein UY75_C0001G0022 [Parcubacteria group bacterium GW2011_GWC2_52_8c]|nr:MAG: hypothetical protein UY64_C0048G0005 [Parcubacteria group bacterium GW2011_GWA1_51_12]KKW31767.1 MAG: hypothetical protein UY75_C0001G0022 [Parcubacteria group bacterium GW2011_GWC2_52_8c]